MQIWNKNKNKNGYKITIVVGVGLNPDAGRHEDFG